MSVERTSTIETDLSVWLEVAFDTDMLIHVVPSIEVDGDEEPTKLDGISLEELMDDVLIQLVDDGDFTSIYCMAHELRRLAEILHSKAGAMEVSDEQIAMQFDMEPERLAFDFGGFK